MALINFVLNACAERLIAVSGQQSPWPSQHAEVAVESVTLFNTVLQKEAVTQGVIAYCVLHLGKKMKKKNQDR